MDVDETLIIHDINGNQQWLLGAIETVKKEVRLEFISNKNTATIKKFFLNHIMARTHITHDGCQGYSFLRGNDQDGLKKNITMVVEILAMVYVVLPI